MKFYCLSNDPNKPCNVITFKGITIMLDCGLASQSVLNFLPLSYVPSPRLMSLPGWMPQDVTDLELEGELRENCDKVFVDSSPEFCPPLEKLIDFSQVDVILISNYLCMLALPYITEETGFCGKVYATDPTLHIGRMFLEELVMYIEQCPKPLVASQWKQHLHKLPSPLADCFRPKSWKRIYTRANLNSSLSKIQMVGYNEKISVYGALQMTPVSSGYCLGSSNWIIQTEFERVAYISASSTLTTHPKPMDTSLLKHADVLIMGSLTQTPTANPDSMLGMLCMIAGMTVRNGGNVLIPCYPSGVIYDLFECLSTSLDSSGLGNIPLFFISPVADTSLAYSNILAEWLSTVKQNKVYMPDEPFPHAQLVRTSRLKFFRHVYSEGLSTEYREPCVVFCGHPSLRFGDSVHFMELWGANPKNVIIFTEPDFDYDEALSPYQPLMMNFAQCPIDTSLNFSQANKLIRELKPGALVIPEQYTQPPANAPSRADLIVDALPDRKTMTYRRGEVLSLPVRRRKTRATLCATAAQNAVPVEVRPGVALASMTGVYSLKSNSIDVEKEAPQTPVLRGPPTTEVHMKKLKYEWGSVNVPELVAKLAKEGISDAKVEKTPNGVIVQLDEFALIQIEENSTHVVCGDDRRCRQKIRNILMQCLKTF